MADSNGATPDFKDRTLGLVIFGAVSVLIGLFCALLVPLMFLSAAQKAGACGVAP